MALKSVRSVIQTVYTFVLYEYYQQGHIIKHFKRQLFDKKFYLSFKENVRHDDTMALMAPSILTIFFI